MLPNLDGEEFRRRFEREAAVLARIRSRHIVVIHEYGEHEGNLFLVTEYFPDGDLSAWLRSRGPLPRHHAIAICSQLAEALADAHAAGVVHRDLKPSNVLLWSRDDGRLIPFLCDFGIATEGNAGLTQTGAVVGSPGYMAPERHLGQPATARGDLYALGCVLWAALTGAAPYSGTDYQLVSAHLHEPVRQLPAEDALGVRLNAVLAQLMAKDPAARPASAASVAADLRVLAEASSAVSGSSPPPAEDATILAHRPEPSSPPATLDPGEPSAPNRVGVSPTLNEDPRIPRRDRSTGTVVAAAIAGLVLLAGAAVAGVYVAGRADHNGVVDQSARSPAASGRQAPTSGTSGATTDARGGGATASSLLCPADAPTTDRYAVTGLVPISGPNSAYGAPMQAGIGLAVADIAAAADTEDPSPCYTMLDSRDGDTASDLTAVVNQILTSLPSVVVGPYGYTAVSSIADTLIDAQIMTITPAATLFAISGRSPYLARTISSGYVEADVLGQLVQQDGHSRVAFVTPDAGFSPYGSTMRTAVENALSVQGIACVFGCGGSGQDFPAGLDDFSALATQVHDSGADAVVVTALSGADAVLSALAAVGVDMSEVYLSDTGVLPYQASLPTGLLTGVQGTIAGVDPPGAFQDRVSTWLRSEGDSAPTTYRYAAEAYDATVLAALAGVRGGGFDSVTIQANLASVSGASGGSTCSSYAECASLVKRGEAIAYAGLSQIGPLNSRNEPSSGLVVVYRYGSDNLPVPTGTLRGQE